MAYIYDETPFETLKKQLQLVIDDAQAAAERMKLIAERAQLAQDQVNELQADYRRRG